MEPNQELLALLRNIADAKHQDLLSLIVKIRDVVDKFENGARKGQAKKDVILSGLLPILIFSLKQNFGKVEENWISSPKVAQFLVDLCINANPSELPDFLDKTLPEAMDCVLYLALRLQRKMGFTREESSRQGLLDSFLLVFDAAGMLVAGYQGLAKMAMESIWLLQMLMSDDDSTTQRVMALIQTINKTRIGIFEMLPKETSRQIVDELVFKILSSKNPAIVSTSARTIIEICKSHPAHVKILTSRYRGLRTYAEKWIQEPFLGDLLLLLETGSLEKYAGKKFENQAIQIQSWWRSWLVRKRLREASNALSSFQASFRQRKESEEKLRQERKMEADLQYMLAVQRKYNMRRLHRRQLHAIQILPSSKVERYIFQEQTNAAVRIQSAWRRFAARRNLPSLGRIQVRRRAATKIQRYYRKYSAKNKSVEKVPVPITSGITEQRRRELQEQITAWKEARKREEQTTEETERLHNEVQMALGGLLLSQQESVEHHRHLEALMAHVTADADFLLGTFDGIGFEGMTTSVPFKSSSLPVSTKAKEEHLDELRHLNKPWWKKLEVEPNRPGGDVFGRDWRIF